jgi:hypothetical protein
LGEFIPGGRVVICVLNHSEIFESDMTGWVTGDRQLFKVVQLILNLGIQLINPLKSILSRSIMYVQVVLGVSDDPRLRCEGDT